MTTLMAAVIFNAAASSFSTMTTADICALLDNSHRRGNASGPVSAKERATRDSDSLPAGAMIPLTVNAHDMIHKIFGIMDAAGSRADSLQRAALALSLYPVLEDSLLWLDSADGYRLSYSGMTPDVAAYARVAPDNSIDGYCYFFIFPHDSVPPVKVIPQEAQFAGTLLQELADMGLNPGADANTDFLFDVYADTPGKTVNVRLADCTLSESDSRYALMFAVTLQSPADAEIETPAR